jgi:ATP-dependent Clp protease ATP-binding subunit ClpA
VSRCDPGHLFERFTEAGRQVVVVAQEEARGLGHQHIGTEHLLVALLRVSDGAAAEVLGSLGVTVERVREQIVKIVRRGEGVTTGQIPFTPRAKKVLELSLREAQTLGHEQIRPEHVLLGLLSETEGVAYRILLESDAFPETIRSGVTSALPGPDPEAARFRKARAHSGQVFASSTGFGAPAGVSFRVAPAPDAQRLLMAAAAHALDEGRTEFAVNDVLLALTKWDETARLLGDLGLDAEALREAIDKRLGGTPPAPA